MRYLVLLGFCCVAFAADIPIVRNDAEINPDGSFSHAYETGDGIIAEARGVLKNAGNPETEAQEVTGSFSFTAPDGTKYAVSYIANEEGFQPQGDHLPVPPEIPSYIQKALDYIAAHPQPEQPGKKF